MGDNATRPIIAGTPCGVWCVVSCGVDLTGSQV